MTLNYVVIFHWCMNFSANIKILIWHRKTPVDFLQNWNSMYLFYPPVSVEIPWTSATFSLKNWLLFLRNIVYCKLYDSICYFLQEVRQVLKEVLKIQKEVLEGNDPITWDRVPPCREKQRAHRPHAQCQYWRTLDMRLCRSWTCLKKPSLDKFRFDATENEPSDVKVLVSFTCSWRTGAEQCEFHHRESKEPAGSTSSCKNGWPGKDGQREARRAVGKAARTHQGG